MVSRDYRPVWRLVAALAVCQVAFGLAYIWRASFVVEGTRYFVLFDDAMISLRYSDNAARGLGLVWNSGERIEGYTNLLWTLLLTPLHWLPLSPQHVCLVVQLIGVGLWIGCTAATAQLARVCRLLPAAAMVAVVLTAAHYNLMFFSIMGMETGLLTLLLTLGLTGSAAALRARRGRLLPGVCYALAAVTRLDAILVGTFALFVQSFAGRRQIVRTLAAGLLLAGTVAVHFAWRHAYYGDWFPNTYYLKATGWPLSERIRPGLEQSLMAVMAFGLPALLSLFAIRKLRARWLLLAGAFGVLLAYQVYVGGDAWPLNRFVIPASPGISVLGALGAHYAARSLLVSPSRSLLIGVRIALTAACVLAINAIHWDHCLLITPAQTTPENRMNIRLARAVEQVSSAEAKIAVVFAGVTPYFTRRPSVDLLGKCDRTIARLPVVPGQLRAGHNKYDFNLSLREHQPDILLHTFMPTEPEVRESYFPARVDIDGEPLVFFVRRGSLVTARVKRISIEDALAIYAKQTPDFDPTGRKPSGQ